MKFLTVATILSLTFRVSDLPVEVLENVSNYLDLQSAKNLQLTSKAVRDKVNLHDADLQQKELDKFILKALDEGNYLRASKMIRKSLTFQWDTDMFSHLCLAANDGNVEFESLVLF
jgi:hypothetical protein